MVKKLALALLLIGTTTQPVKASELTFNDVFKGSANVAAILGAGYGVYSLAAAIAKSVKMHSAEVYDKDDIRQERNEYVREGALALGTAVLAKMLADGNFKNSLSALVFQVDIVRALELLFGGGSRSR